MKASVENRTDNHEWPLEDASPLTCESLNALFDGQIPAVVLPNFISTADCEKIVENLREMGMGTYSHVNHAVGRLGLAQMEYHLKQDKKGYFDRVIAAIDTYKRAVARSEDPLEKLFNHLISRGIQNVSLAKEQDYGSYFAGSFRNVMTVGHLHYDFAPFEAKGWDIAGIEKQVSWNLYLNQPTGGDLHVYKRFYNPDDESLRVSGEYYYDRSLISGADQYRYSPRVGDIVMFNCRYFHEVKPVNGDRYSLSSFIGKKQNGDLIFWS